MSDQPNPEVAILNASLELPAGERAAYLDKACASDAKLRQRVEELLWAHHQAEDFLEAPPAGLDFQRTVRVNVPLTEKPGDKIGRYKLLQQIGEGGCGVVYMAEQEEPVRRRVALKVIKLGMDTKQVIARFEAERQALALMDHPNIAKVLDVGATETGRPYFVMELVRGIKITDFCDENNLSTADRLKLFIQVCQAIQHAHQKGVIHRDIKPSNILVTINDPGSPGVPKVIDFGIAKATQGRLTDHTLFTAFEQFIGTPAYMSPEQAVLTALDIDTRSDIYSLGVLLYELLTGRTPFAQKELLTAGLDEMRRTIREREPSKPSTCLSTMLDAEQTAAAKHRRTEALKLIHLIRGDLDWVAMKALEKDRSRRYETANGLAMDLQRHLDDEPVVARPPSTAYRFQKLVRRHKLAFAASAAVLLVLVGGIAASTWQAIRATRAEREQTRSRKEAEGEKQIAQTEAAKSQQVARFLTDMLQGVAPSVALGRDTTMLREILDKTSERVGKDLTNQPAVEAELRRTIGNVYFNLGELDQAESMHREALRIERKLYGTDDPAITESLHTLGGTLWKLGKLTEAESLIREKLAIQKRSLGDDDPAIFDSLYVLGLVLWNEGKLAEAESIHRAVLASRRKELGNDHYVTADSMNALGVVLREEGKLAEAEATHREALAILRKLFGNEHPAVSISLRNVGLVLLSEQRFAEAEAVDREALAIDRKMLGDHHYQLMASLVELARALSNQDQLPEAERLLREAVDVSQKTLLYNPMDWNYAVQTLTDLRTREGKGGEAERILKETLGRAETMCSDALAAKRKAWPNDPARWRTVLNTLSNALRAQGKLAEDEALLREELVYLRASLPADDPQLAAALTGLTSTLLFQRKFVEAEQSARECLAIREKKLPDDWLTFNARATLGDSLFWQKKYPEAEPLLLSGYKGMKQRQDKVPADSKQYVKGTVHRLVDLYEATGQSEKAAEWNKKLAEFDQP